MTTQVLSEIHDRIEQASEARAGIWHRLSEAHDPDLAGELKRLDAELDRLWDEHRSLRARLRFGDRTAIVARARVEERLERAA